MRLAPRRSWSRRVAFSAIVSLLGLARGAVADAIPSGSSPTYSISAQLQPTGIDGPNLIALSGPSTESATLPSSGSITLGSFQTIAPSGQTTTYSGTPFTIGFTPSQGGVQGCADRFQRRAQRLDFKRELDRPRHDPASFGKRLDPDLALAAGRPIFFGRQPRRHLDDRRPLVPTFSRPQRFSNA